MPNNAIIPIGNLSGSITTGGLVPGLPIWTGEASGSIANFPDGSDNPILSLDFSVNPVQAAGTPSPSNPLPISGWTGANIERCGINLWDEEWEEGTISTTTGQDIYASNRARSKNYISVKPNTTYYFYFSDSVTTMRRFYYDKYKNLLSYDSVQIANQAYMTPNNCYYMRFITTKDNLENDQISINYPSTNTSYHAYNGTTYPITWSEAGTVYGGYIDYERKKVVVDKAEYNITSTRDFIQNGEDVIGMSVESAYRKDIIPQCECFEGITRGSSSGLAVNQCRLNVAMNYINFKFSTPKTVDEWKAELSNNPIKLILGLVTPLEYNLDEPTPTITTILGTNNIWSDTGDIDKVIYMRDWNIALNMLWEAVFG